jgi:hypothetical protein
MFFIDGFDRPQSCLYAGQRLCLFCIIIPFLKSCFHTCKSLPTISIHIGKFSSLRFRPVYTRGVVSPKIPRP